MTSHADLKKLRALDEERVALERKRAEARDQFAMKLGAALVKALGEEGAANLVAMIGALPKKERPTDIVGVLQEARAKQARPVITTALNGADGTPGDAR